MKLVIALALCLALNIKCIQSGPIQTITVPNTAYDEDDCAFLPSKVVEDIASKKDVVNKIISEFLRSDGMFKNIAYNGLCEFIDTFGSRLSGTKNLEDAIDYMVKKSVQHFSGNNTRISTESVKVPFWSRGEESATLIKPRQKDLKIAGLGYSVATPPEGITAPVIVVKSFDELKSISDEDVSGKIVVYDEEYIDYSQTVVYRSKGASEASKKGAVAALVRSIGSFDIGLPHTGMQSYEDGVKPIPVAAITWADADQLRRMQRRGKEIVITLKMNASLRETRSRNTIVELQGNETPEKFVITSGHIDSWDKGEGAMDDGAGMIISWLTPLILHKLNITPKRSIRAILWTAEEVGLVGVADYKRTHKNELDNLVFAMELDIGVFEPLGITYSGDKNGQCVMKEIVKLFKDDLNATEVEVTEAAGSDIIEFTGDGYPGAELKSKNERYFWYHHSDGDRMNVLNKDDLDKSAALWVSLAYVMADIDYVIPRLTKSSINSSIVK